MTLRDEFWAELPSLPPGLGLERHEPVVANRTGPGGVSIFDVCDLVTTSARLPLIIAYQTRLLASHVPKLATRLTAVAHDYQERRLASGHKNARLPLAAIVTDVAKPSVIEACRAGGIALLDRRGTVVVNANGNFIYVEGHGPVQRDWRGRLFSGRASRVVRFLLTEVAREPVAVPRTGQSIATACDVSYAYAHGILTKLERDGFVERRTSHAGFRLRDPLGLLKAWVASGERTAVAVEGYYASATSRAALVAAAKKIKDATGDIALFTLASALEPDEVHVSGLPHGAYWNGELDTIVDALKLRRTTPHNFLVLRPDPLVWTASGGLFLRDKARPDPEIDDGFKRVPLPQLAADFAAIPGRGKEEADFLVGVYARSLPYLVGDE